MITLDEARKLSQKIGVSTYVVLMESYQVLILNEISEITLSKKLIFKGGTCLKLVYGSFRFSEDLDFSSTENIQFSEFKQIIEKLVKPYPEMIVDEIYDMKQTLFARIVATREEFKIGIKIEVSKRIEKWLRNKDYKSSFAISETSMYKPFINSSSLERIYADKLKAIKTRNKARDWFDLWFLTEILHKKWNMRVKISRKLMEDRVRFLLPESKRSVLNEFIYEND